MSMAQQQNQVILQFRFGTFGDSMLQKMNLLRRQTRFCDVTVRINDLEVPGHKVVLAAGSPFLRDQFFLQDSSTREVQISMTQEAEVGQRLLLSCYTGTLELPELELVNYLTVASFLQMGHVVEQCTQALKKFIQPRHCQVKQQPQEEEGDGETLRASPIQKIQELPHAQVHGRMVWCSWHVFLRLAQSLRQTGSAWLKLCSSTVQPVTILQSCSQSPPAPALNVTGLLSTGSGNPSLRTPGNHHYAHLATIITHTCTVTSGLHHYLHYLQFI